MERERNERRQGRRLRAMEGAFHKTVKYALRGASLEEFAGYFPTLSPQLVEVIYDAYRQSLHQARVYTEADFDQLVEESELMRKLLDLEQMCEEQGIHDDADLTNPDNNDKKMTINPTVAARAALLAAKQQEIAHLTSVMAQVQADTDRLATERAKRTQAAQEVMKHVQPITMQLKQVDAAAKLWANRVN